MDHRDESEFREFFAGRQLALSRTAYLLTGDHEAAEDLLQEALTRTLVRWSAVTAGGNPEGYVRRIMLNQVRSRWRRSRRHREEPHADLPEHSSTGMLQEESAARHDLARALRRLGPRQRTVLYLRYYEDMSEAEVASMLGCALGTVKSQTHDALARLRVIAPELFVKPDSAEVIE